METLMEMPLETPLELPRTVQQAKARPARTARWYALCQLDELEDSWGEAVLINGQQLALFRVGASQVFAVSHADPATRSHVMARGLVGSRGDVPTIASPLHKEVYSLSTGECFGHPELHLGTYPVRVVDGAIEVSLDMCR